MTVYVDCSSIIEALTLVYKGNVFYCNVDRFYFVSFMQLAYVQLMLLLFRLTFVAYLLSFVVILIDSSFICPRLAGSLPKGRDIIVEAICKFEACIERGPKFPSVFPLHFVFRAVTIIFLFLKLISEIL